MGILGIKRAAALCVACAMVSASVGASFGPPDSGDRREAPQAAFDACKGKSEGTAVEIATPNGDTIKAICKKFEDRLVAVPEGAPPPPPKN
jgi:hypothetical protein